MDGWKKFEVEVEEESIDWHGTGTGVGFGGLRDLLRCLRELK